MVVELHAFVQMELCHCGRRLLKVAAYSNGHVKVYELLDPLELKNWQLQAEFQNVIDSVSKFGKAACLSASISWTPQRGESQQLSFVLGFNSNVKQLNSAKVPQIGPFEEETVQLQCLVPEPQSPANSKEADHPSPVLVLEAPFVEDVNVKSPSSECFGRVNADLHGLRMQLKLLKMESGANTDGLMLTASDKDVGQGFVSVSEDNEVFNDESWESFHLIDVLIDSGYDDVDPDTFVSTWYSLDWPYGPLFI